MKENPCRAALVIIDMENGFVLPGSGNCIKGAYATIPKCAAAARAARKKGIPVFFVKRVYRTDGSDVELTRYKSWKDVGRTCTPGSSGVNSQEFVKGLEPQPGDYTIIKPRWSAFFGTELDLVLRRLDIRTVVIAGATTPNCIRTTCYDALALEYMAVVLTDCTSSNTDEIQKSNLEDMERVGAVLMDEKTFEDFSPETLEDVSETIRMQMMKEDIIPE